VFVAPRHPYTRALLDAAPSRMRRGRRLETIPGSVPSLTSMPAACRFADRCRFVMTECRQGHPDLLAEGSGRVRCLLYSAGTHAAVVSSVSPVAETQPASRAPSSRNGQAADNLVVVDRLDVHFRPRSGRPAWPGRRHRRAVRAVDDVTLEIRRGEVLGVVGESGSGKTTLARAMLGLVPPSGGHVRFADKRVERLRRRELRRFRREAQMIFQEPVSGLSPRLKVSYLLDEPYLIHSVPRDERYSRGELLAMVGLQQEHLSKYPHQLSGGQARRVGIARALALRPRFLVADEPTASLDLSVGGSILNLMAQLVADFHLTFMVITHNLATVGYIADRVAVMYLGSIVEIGPTRSVFDAPAHPYTRALLAAVPDTDPRRRRTTRLLLPGEIPSPQDVPSGCRFHTRCPFARERCHIEAPLLETVGPDHQAACHYWPEIRSAPFGGEGLELAPPSRTDAIGSTE
jgi:peptide/nickel transport system ATP-binding protein